MIVVALLSLAVFAYAQADESSPEDNFARMKTGLDLTQAQIDSMKGIVEEYSAKLVQLRQGLKDEGVYYDRATSEQIKKLEEEGNQKLLQVLTPDQAQKWKNKQGLRSYFDMDKTSDKGWESKGSGSFLGASF